MYRVKDDSVTRRGRGRPRFAGKQVTHRGEDLRKHRREAGRYEEPRERGGRTQRVVGKSTGRDVSSVGPARVIDPRMPHLI